MNIKRKGKINIEIAPSESILIQDNITWEIRTIETTRKEIITFIKPKKHFMKLFATNYTDILEKNWDDMKNIMYLIKYTDIDNSINMDKFDNSIWGSSSTKSKRRSRLINRWVIAKDWNIFYLNPCIAIKTESIDSRLWTLFKEKNATLYSITEL